MPTDVFEWYRILEVRPGASPDEIKEAYLDLVKVWHPDRLQDEHPRLRQKAEEKLKQLNLAYARLIEHVSHAPDFATGFANGLPAPAAAANVNAAATARLRPRYFGGLWGYVDDKGKVVLPPQYLVAESFRSGLACVKLPTRRYGFISPSGEFAISSSFERAHGFSDGVAAVRLNRKWGYIDASGAFSIYPVFEDARSFRQQFAAVKIEGLWGFISKSGEFIIAPRFEQADDFNGGWAWVKMPGARDRLRVNPQGEMFAA